MFRAGKCPDPEETAGAQPGHGLRDNPEVGPEGESRGVWCSVVLCFVVLSHDVVMFPVPLRCTEVLHQAGRQPPDQRKDQRFTAGSPGTVMRTVRQD